MMSSDDYQVVTTGYGNYAVTLDGETLQVFRNRLDADAWIEDQLALEWVAG